MTTKIQIKRIQTLLIANRAEIACRIARSCRDLGVRSVAVYSNADADLPHVREADLALHIGAAPADASYLNVEAILEAARRSGADAVHPGYGFLAENAAFAEAVQAAGLCWVGPPPAAIRAMGDKAAARKLAAEIDVPTVPGYDGEDTSLERLRQEAARIGYPVLIKASAGGGGRGMRRVEAEGELESALASAKREAAAAFGDDRVLLERYVEKPRHVEIQLMADAHGNVVHLFERECSVQRRHQKIIEEAPSPAVDEALRERMGAAAVALAKRVGYVGAGTVELLLQGGAAGGEFYFLEMNTRLQVEHPVTEMITDVDLVALQLAVAEGQELPFMQEELVFEGAAIEARIYAEDPLRDYLPSSGVLARCELGEGLGGVRVDAGYGRGDKVGVNYDPMLAKVIAWGESRDLALRRLASALEQAWVPGVTTNLPLLRQVLRNEGFAAGELDTHFLARHGLPKAPPLNLELGALAATVLAWLLRADAAPFHRALPLGFRIEGAAEARDRWHSFGSEFEVSWRAEGARERGARGDSAELVMTLHAVNAEGEAASDGIMHRARRLYVDDELVCFELDGIYRSVRYARSGEGETLDDAERVYLHFGDVESVVELVPRFAPPASAADEPGSCVAPTPGTVVAIHVEAGARVEAGAKLVTLEAMKMEHVVAAPEAGTVASVPVQVGDSVDQGALLVQLDVESAE
ncbi:MAG: ATP-grasp domain-containing protein [Myxococcales bacterium]|nr:ATP-grasp domain-containing protein [Myxococcales bacterium]